MGRLISGKWIQEEIIQRSQDREFKHEEASIRNTIEEGANILLKLNVLIYIFL